MAEIDLLELKQKIEEKKEELNRTKGKLDYLKKELKKTWKCDTLEQAEKKLQEMKKKIDKLEESLEKGIEQLEEKYGSEMFEE